MPRGTNITIDERITALKLGVEKVSTAGIAMAIGRAENTVGRIFRDAGTTILQSRRDIEKLERTAKIYEERRRFENSLCPDEYEDATVTVTSNTSNTSNKEDTKKQSNLETVFSLLETESNTETTVTESEEAHGTARDHWSLDDEVEYRVYHALQRKLANLDTIQAESLDSAIPLVNAFISIGIKKSLDSLAWHNGDHNLYK
jgi:hypothetical protein